MQSKCGIKLQMKNKLNFHVQLYLRKTQFDVILKCDSISNLLYHKHSQDISSSEEDKKQFIIMKEGTSPILDGQMFITVGIWLNMLDNVLVRETNQSNSL